MKRKRRRKKKRPVRLIALLLLSALMLWFFWDELLRLVRPVPTKSVPVREQRPSEEEISEQERKRLEEILKQR